MNNAHIRADRADGEERIQQLLELVNSMYWVARDEDHFDGLLATLLTGENRAVALDVESRFWQSIPTATLPEGGTVGS
jgi:hypothetical protein